LQDADDEVALEAAEFWLAFCESDLGMELLIPVMSRLIPVLMKNMVSFRVLRAELSVTSFDLCYISTLNSGASHAV
jgi:hypothetical protein